MSSHIRDVRDVAPNSVGWSELAHLQVGARKALGGNRHCLARWWVIRRLDVARSGSRRFVERILNPKP